jgi:hypothetical protein
MSRSGYSDDLDPQDLALWRGAVNRAIRGNRGQAFLREMAAAMDAMPVKELIAAKLVDDGGGVCAIGTVCQARGLDVSDVDYHDSESVGKAVGIARAMAAEIEYENDECAPYRWREKREPETPAERWRRMRKWVDENIKSESQLVRG